jgi:ribosome-associated protein
MKAKPSASLELVKICCRVLEDKKAGDLRVLDVHEQSSITNFLVLATGTSDPHLRALRVEVEKALDGAKARIVGMDATNESGWIVIDAFDVMIHLFLSAQRENYGLENLWKDAVEVSVPALLSAPERAGRKRTAAAKPPGAKKKAAAPRKPRKA